MAKIVLANSAPSFEIAEEFEERKDRVKNLLYGFVQKGNLEMIKEVLSVQQLDVVQAALAEKTGGLTPLALAAMLNYKDVVSFFLEKSVNLPSTEELSSLGVHDNIIKMIEYERKKRESLNKPFAPFDKNTLAICDLFNKFMPCFYAEIPILPRTWTVLEKTLQQLDNPEQSLSDLHRYIFSKDGKKTAKQALSRKMSQNDLQVPNLKNLESSQGLLEYSQFVLTFGRNCNTKAQCFRVLTDTITITLRRNRRDVKDIPFKFHTPQLNSVICDFQVEPAKEFVTKHKPKVTISVALVVLSSVHIFEKLFFIEAEGRRIPFLIRVPLECPNLEDLEFNNDQLSDESLLGWGAQGKVSKAVLNGTQLVAVKRPHQSGQNFSVLNLHPNFASPSKEEGPTYKVYLNKFYEEIRISSRLDHPNVVKVLGVNTTPGHFAFAMEYFELGNLKRVLSENKSLSKNLRLKFLLDSALGIKYLHHCGITHRDIKDTNVLIKSLDESSDVHAKISDFGSARVISPYMTHLMTKNVGTTEWQAPEAQTHFYGHKVDVYSFGILMWATLATQGQDYFEPERLIGTSLQEINSNGFINLALWRQSPAEKALNSRMGTMDDSLKQLTKICIQISYEKRPPMCYVLKRLLIEWGGGLGARTKKFNGLRFKTDDTIELVMTPS